MNKMDLVDSEEIPTNGDTGTFRWRTIDRPFNGSRTLNRLQHPDRPGATDRPGPHDHPRVRRHRPRPRRPPHRHRIPTSLRHPRLTPASTAQPTPVTPTTMSFRAQRGIPKPSQRNQPPSRPPPCHSERSEESKASTAQPTPATQHLVVTPATPATPNTAAYTTNPDSPPLSTPPAQPTAIPRYIVTVAFHMWRGQCNGRNGCSRHPTYTAYTVIVCVITGRVPADRSLMGLMPSWVLKTQLIAENTRYGILRRLALT